MPAGPVIIASFNERSELKTSAKVYSETRPNRISASAMPKSKSNKITEAPERFKLIAKFSAIFVLPTPPFPLAMVITRFNGSDFSFILFLKTFA
jgi:hypothetical protein